jgi:hypothetical protein
MWLFIVIYVVFLVLEAVSEIVKIKKGKKDVIDSFLPTIFGFSFATSSVNSDSLVSGEVSKILFAYTIVYAIYWMSLHCVKMYYIKK